VDIETEIEQFFHALTLHETVCLGRFAGSAGLPLAALLGLVPSNPRFGSAEQASSLSNGHKTIMSRRTSPQRLHNLFTAP
jgi:hypothetical protein